MGLPFIDMEIDVAQYFLFADIYMEVFNMQHNTIEECMSIAALNAFQRDIYIPAMEKTQITGMCPAPGFQSRSGFHAKITDRFCRENHDPGFI
jgi:hypothetical protein